MRAFGVALGVSESTVGMTVLGIGNGLCDLIANYLVGSKGFPKVAIAAVYGGPVSMPFAISTFSQHHPACETTQRISTSIALEN